MPAPVIYVDADASPVKDEVVRVGERYGLVVVFVSNGGIRPSRDPMIRTVVVPQGADVADDWIIEQCQANDVVITSDIPLASRAVTAGAHVLGPTGREYTPQSMGMALAMRDLKQHLRETGEIMGYNPGFTAKDRSAFLVALDRVAQRAVRAAQG